MPTDPFDPYSPVSPEADRIAEQEIRAEARAAKPDAPEPPAAVQSEPDHRPRVDALATRPFDGVNPPLPASFQPSDDESGRAHCDAPAQKTAADYDSPLDPGIADAVVALAAGGVETFESCEGGHGHAYTEPTVRFHGDTAEGYRALAVALRAGLAVRELRRVWPIVEKEPTGPWWELTFRPKVKS